VALDIQNKFKSQSLLLLGKRLASIPRTVIPAAAMPMISPVESLEDDSAVCVCVGVVVALEVVVGVPVVGVPIVEVPVDTISDISEYSFNSRLFESLNKIKSLIAMVGQNVNLGNSGSIMAE
jgi:hypothetical protein